MLAILFDLDDTLAATSTLWRRAETRLLQSLNHPWTPELAATYKGMNARDVAATIHRTLHPPITLQECQHRFRSWLLEEFHTGPLLPMPGAIQCVQLLAQHAALAIASGAPLEAIEKTLTTFHLRPHFTLLLSSESVPHGKPHPDVFLAAAAQLKIPPTNCLVIEDSLIGLQAARAANMPAFVIPSSNNPEIPHLATRTFNFLADITWQDVQATHL